MKNMMILSALAVSIVAGTTLQSGAASGHGNGPRHSFEELDANSDGQLTKDEMAAHMKARFDGADADGNGILTRAEMEANGKKKAGKRANRMIERLDTNGDDGVSFAELQAGRGGKMFERVDADGDGAITKAEFDAARETMRRGHKHGKSKSAD